MTLHPLTIDGDTPEERAEHVARIIEIILRPQDPSDQSDPSNPPAATL
jgi:hypothetical protein